MKVKFEIRVPQNASDLRIENFGFVKLGQALISDTSINGMVNTVNAVTNVSKRRLMLLNEKQISEVYYNCLASVSGFNVGKFPPNEITLSGNVYELINPEKVGIGWHIDFGEAVKLKLIDKDPTYLACLFYHPRGEVYGSLDDNDNLISPISSKYTIFKNELPLSTYVECLSFFLQKFLKSTEKSIQKEIVMQKTMMAIKSVSRTLGRKV